MGRFAYSAPMVTVLMAVYNGGDSLRPTIESILGQTYKDSEFLIINDGSTDSSLDVIGSYDDERIVVYNNEANLGQTKSLNIGLRLTRGKYVARIDAGDFSFATRLEEQLEYMIKHPEYAVVGTSGVMVDSSGKRKGIVHAPDTFPEILIRLFYTSPLIHISALMHKDTIVNLGGYDENFRICADYELWSKLIRNGYRFTSLADILVGYRMVEDSLSFRNLYGMTTSESSEIIRRNVNSLTDLKISFEEAQKIYKMFIPGLQNLSLDEIEETETLFKDIFRNLKNGLGLNISYNYNKDINRLLSRCYLKLALHHIENERLVEARHATINSFKKYNFQILPFLIFLSTFLGKNITKKVKNMRYKWDMITLMPRVIGKYFQNKL